MILKFIAAVLLLSSSFYFGGLALALIFKLTLRICRNYIWPTWRCRDIRAYLYLTDEYDRYVECYFYCIAIPYPCCHFSQWEKYMPLLAVVVWAISIGNADTLLQSHRPERAPLFMNIGMPWQR